MDRLDRLVAGVITLLLGFSVVTVVNAVVVGFVKSPEIAIAVAAGIAAFLGLAYVVGDRWLH